MQSTPRFDAPRNSVTVPDFAAANAAPLDVLLRGGVILDGTGAERFRADIGVRDGRIVAVGDLGEARANRVVEAAGLFVCPGFIDIHTHSDLSVLYTPGMDSSLAQGVTSEVVGNCGFSLGLARASADFSGEQRGLERAGLVLDWDDLTGFFARVEEQGIATNIATLAGHGTLRKRAMGLANRAPSESELNQMQRDLNRAMEQGAVGLSSGLEYVPGMYADVAEMTALARVAQAANGFYATHLRDEGDAVEEAVLEALAVAEGAGIALQLSHHKAEKPRNWGKVAKTLALVDEAEARGVDVLLDQYPYTAYQTGLATIALPPWAVAGTPQALAEKLSDPDTRARARAAMDGVSWGAVEIASSPRHREQQGRTVAELASDAGLDPRDWVLNLLSEGDAWVSAAHFALSEDDVERVMRDGRVAIGSDAVAISPTGIAAADRPHPRSYGAFARVLGRYVRERGVLTWEEAVRRMTTLPARRLRWSDRGKIAPGYVADITVFDGDTIVDAATFAAPHAPAVGVRYVLVNGVPAVEDGRATGSRSGRVIRRID